MDGKRVNGADRDIGIKNGETTPLDTETGNRYDDWVRAMKGVQSPGSALWSQRVRDCVSNHMLTQFEIDEKRSELLVPGISFKLAFFRHWIQSHRIDILSQYRCHIYSCLVMHHHI